MNISGRVFKIPLFPLVSAHAILCGFSIVRLSKELFLMEWTTPRHEEIDLNCEVSSYANAEL